MNNIINSKIRLKGFRDTIIRFPLSIVLLLAAAVTNAMAINTQVNDLNIKLFISLILGASVYSVCQLLYERLLPRALLRTVMMGISIISSIVYYLFIRNTHWDEEVTIRTIVIFFLLLVAFLWVPVIKRNINFNQSFMAVFKGFFVAVFFTGILFLGTALILRAIEMLIVRVNEKAYIHSANLIFVLLAPTYFLSLIPFYSKQEEVVGLKTDDSKLITQPEGENVNYPANKKEQVGSEEVFNKLVSPSKFLETLISYIIIPVTAVFTIILLLYIIMNISGDFWTDNLMEPLLLSYSITVIIVYLLASSMKNVFAGYFRRIFPKVLVPVVLFQTLSSILKIGDVGITYGRYYVILFGIFATVAGVLFCVIPVCKNGIIAPILMVLSFISIIPPIDAFTVSRFNQIGRLENALKRNEMLKGETIIPNSDISKKDQEIILSSIRYLDRMDYTKGIGWLSDYYNSFDIQGTFGFAESGFDKNINKEVYIGRNDDSPIPIAGYEYLIYRNINSEGVEFQVSNFEYEGKSYSLRLDTTSKDNQLILLELDGQNVIQFELNNIFNKFRNSNSGMVNTQEVTFTSENEAATLTVIAQNININEWGGGRNWYADLYIMVDIK